MEDALKGLTEGRIVHYVMPNGAHRPAIVVNVVSAWGPGYVNLQVFTDVANDGVSHGMEWRTSVPYRDPAQASSPEDLIGTWHWPERV